MSKIEDEKNNNITSSQEVSPESLGDEYVKRHGNVLDLAARAHLEGVEYEEDESNAVLRRIDWHLMPLLVWICKCSEAIRMAC